MADQKPGNALVLDVGKTHVRLAAVSSADEIVDERQRDNTVIDAPPYPHFDIDGIWDWFLTVCREMTRSNDFDAVIVTTHGSAGALVDPALAGNGLALPVADYEFRGFESCNDAYAALRPPFTISYSPPLSGGLNLGRQLYWQQTNAAAGFARTRAILLYPQYWSWRLSGRLASEITSIGCHSDLWEPGAGRFSTLAEAQGWAKRIPAFVSAWQSLGFVASSVAATTGLSNRCRVFPGLHDSNAGFYRYLRRHDEAPFTLVSTGTWVVSMSAGATLQRLDASRDMLANVDALGRPVACARYMGGREYAQICEAAGVDLAQPVEPGDIAAAIANGYAALPDFSGGSGPFAGAPPCLVGDAAGGAAVAALYSALMIDHELDLLGATGDVIIEGVFAGNSQLCRLLAQLRSPQPVLSSPSGSDVVLGAALATRGASARARPRLQPCHPARFDGLLRYKMRWRQRLRR